MVDPLSRVNTVLGAFMITSVPGTTRVPASPDVLYGSRTVAELVVTTVDVTAARDCAHSGVKATCRF